MPRIDQIYQLEATQAELDFVNITTDHDVRLFIEPYAIAIKNDRWSQHCHEHITSFFQTLIDMIRGGHHADALELMSFLGEPNQTGLGYSTAHGRGRGIRGEKAVRLYTALRRSRAVQTGLMSDLGETDLFVDGISRDGISDLTANLIRGPLIRYTQEQCKAWEIPLQPDVAADHAWDPVMLRWNPVITSLPVHDGDYIILTPKYSVRRNLVLNSQEYYSHHVVNFIQEQQMRTGGGLVRTLQNGSRRVFKQDVKDANPFSKDFLAKFSEQHPQVLERYKEMYVNLPGADGAPTNSELDRQFDERVFAQALIEELGNIPPGFDAATRYHRFMVGVIEFLFYPSLIFPEVEPKLHQGRKRLDIWYTNAASSGFFHTVLTNPRHMAALVAVECKNYGRDIGNPEFDQLSGRFSDDRGWFGILCHREHANRDRVISSCCDTARDNRGLILPLEDTDLTELLGHIAAGRRSEVDGWLYRKYREIIAA